MTSVVSPATDSFFDKDVKGYKIQGTHQYESQMKEVLEIIKQDKLINQERLESEVNWFYGGLGLDRLYFENNTASEIAGHILSLYSAKILSQTNGTDLELRLQGSQKQRAMFVGRSMPGQRVSPCVQLEQTIEENYLGLGYTSGNRHGSEKKENLRYRLQCYRTTGGVSEASNIHLRLYFLSEPQYANPNSTSNNIQDIADVEFLRTVDAHKKNQIQALIEEATNKVGPVVRVFDTDVPDQKCLSVVFRSGTTHSFFSGVTDVYHSLGMKSTTKYVEQFANGMTLFYLNLKTVDPGRVMDVDFIRELVDQTTLNYMLARTSLTPLLVNGVFNIWEHAYAYSAWKFAFQFLGRQNVEFLELAKAVKGDAVASALLDRIKNVVRKEAYTEGRVLDTILEYPHLVKELYRDFERFNRPNHASAASPVFNEDLWTRIRKTVLGDLDQQIFRAFLTFNQHVLKTNFYKSDKLALSFRLDPRFLAAQYPVVPFGMFFVVGSEFRGFHVRFRDIARGGIRIIRSVNLQAFTQNVTTVFDENYNLAATQDRKNKDIPEGGSKGTILLSADHQDKSFAAFKKYIDSLLDLLSPNPMVVDHYKKEEILFMGPDEGTADMMNWASQHAKERGFKFWKAFTTGKSRDRGGIPHDLYGMTTRSIHQYVLGILEKLNLSEESCTKFQTGGPDGDLGSNEIKISKDKTVAIVDGSGVLYDPNGLDKEELLRCATARIMVRQFDKKKLSPNGFFADVEMSDIKLPDGTVVASGLEFRNNFHVNSLATADIFVPCGGRPESINLSNVNVLIDKDTKKPRFKYIVEGANLFFTQEARLLLEKQGVVIFKDASANKGGVTSSSLEVLAALSLTDEEFDQHMSVKETEPQFYKDYVEEVQRVIESNARMEFECIWEEHKKTGTPRALLSDTISNKIVELSTSIGESELWNNEPMRRRVLQEACPKVLLRLLNGVDKVLQRVPESYLKAIFSRYLASRYVYKCGIAKNPEFAFFAFLQPFLQN